MKKTLTFIICISIVSSVLFVSGCGGGYQNSWIYPDEIQSVYVEMFDTTSFRRGHEFTLTDAICKRLEAQSPYKIISDRNVADSVLSGKMHIGSSVLATDYYSGRPIEQETFVNVTVMWKNLKTGEILIEEGQVNVASSYSTWMGQTFEYSIDQAVNKAAVQVVELMEIPFESMTDQDTK